MDDMDDTVTVCNRCGSVACWHMGGDICSYDGGRREAAEVPGVKIERTAATRTAATMVTNPEKPGRK